MKNYYTKSFIRIISVACISLIIIACNLGYTSIRLCNAIKLPLLILEICIVNYGTRQLLFLEISCYYILLRAKLLAQLCVSLV